MITLQEAPPRRVVNWYRVGLWVMLFAFLAFLVWSAIFTAPYMIEFMRLEGESTSPGINKLVSDDGYGLFFQIVVLVGAFVWTLVAIVAIAAALWLLWKIIVGVGFLIDWYIEKMQESDRKAKEYSGYHD